MEIRLLDRSTILIKGKNEGVVVNPGDSEKVDVRTVLYSDQREILPEVVDKNKVVINGPGEYEVGGIEIWGLSGGEGKVIYILTVDGVRIGYLGNLEEALSEKKETRIEKLDVLVGMVGLPAMDGKKLRDLAKKWGANYLVPIGFESENDESLKKFLDDVDEEGLESVDGLKVDRDSLPEGMEVVVLKIRKV